MLEHLARRRGAGRSPAQVEQLKDACASWDAGPSGWRGSVRDRLLWSLLAETGMRLREALSLQHRDWHTGLGETPFVEVVPRYDHPHGLRAKGQAHRRIYVSEELDRLYGDFLVELCERGVEQRVEDLERHFVFVNLYREPRFAPLRPETMRSQVLRLRGRLPAEFTPHWLRHTHPHGAAHGRAARARRLAPAGARGHPDDPEPLRLGRRTPSSARWRSGRR